MLQTILITGCTEGLGKALALKFSQLNCHVYAVGRNGQALEELSKSSNFIHPILADIATPEGRAAITEQVKNPLSIIHNAAIAKPNQFESMPEALLREHFETNLFAPLLITQQLLSFLDNGQRVLNISSGAANIPLSGLMPYCTTKAALEFVTRCLNTELNPRGVYCASLRPGMIDTRMQSDLRNTDKHILPNQEFYLHAKNENTLIKPEKVAEFVAWVLMKTENNLFSETVWNIYEKKYEENWQCSIS